MTAVQIGRDVVTAISNDTNIAISIIYSCSKCGNRSAFIIPKVFHFGCEWSFSRIYQREMHLRHWRRAMASGEMKNFETSFLVQLL